MNASPLVGEYNHQRLQTRERAYGDRREIAAELAVHFERGRDLPRAVQHYQHAAENAMRRFGYQEAIVHLSKGLALLATQADSPERAKQEIALQSTLGAASMATQGYAAPAVERAYARVHALCQQVHATAHLDSALRGLWAYHLTRTDLHTAQAFAEQLQQVAQQTQTRTSCRKQIENSDKRSTSWGNFATPNNTWTAVLNITIWGNTPPTFFFTGKTRAWSALSTMPGRSVYWAFSIRRVSRPMTRYGWPRKLNIPSA